MYVSIFAQTNMKLYNTLNGRKEEFVPITEGKVRMYACGPTVYNYFHIGNARPFIVFDLLRRYFEYRGYDVIFVQNFTDVDDKIINKAKEEGITPIELADKYIKEYFKDADALGIRRATVHPRVTETIPEIITFIEGLIDNGHAYESEGDVYFATRKFDQYGKLSKKNIDDLIAGARVDVSEIKRDPLDFALWKKAKEGEISWDSPWGKGRPGWHIECSVMSSKYLGDTIDIHGGGQDLIFPHHENEIAQSESLHNCPFARYWMHNGYINIDNQKMSKSLGNFFTVRDILKEFPGEAVRYFLISSHYKSPINFTKDVLQQAQVSLERIKTCKQNLIYMLDKAKEKPDDDINFKQRELDKFRAEFIEAMDDDLNTATAISVIFQLVKFANTKVDENSSKEWIRRNLNMLNELTAVLNIGNVHTKDQEGDEEIQALVDKRTQAKKDKDFALADKIRDELEEKGIIIEDTRQGTRWKRQ